MISLNQLIIVAWSLAPWFCLLLGLHYLHSIFWTFFLYHGCCAIPAIIWKRHHWSQHLGRPTVRQILILAAAVLLFSAYTYFGYHFLGTHIFSKARALASLNSRGFEISWLVPMSVYFVTVNPLIEELFWRGVVLNELSNKETKLFSTPVLWTNFLFAAWHVLAIRLFVAPLFMYVAVCVVLSVGIFLSWLYRRTNSLILPTLWHALVFDLAVVILLWSVVLS